MRCPNCNLDQPTARSCSNCGAPLVLACARCGFENPATFKFCGQCAAPLAPTAPPAEASGPSTLELPSLAELDRMSPVPPPVSFPSPRISIPQPTIEDTLYDAEEGRLVTVLFCDLVGAAQLS